MPYVKHARLRWIRITMFDLFTVLITPAVRTKLMTTYIRIIANGRRDRINESEELYESV